MLSDVELVLLMSVNPGFGGQSFIEFTFDKIRQLDAYRTEHDLDFLISVDGGVNIHNAEKLYQSGVDVLVVGTTFFKSTDRSALVDAFPRYEPIDEGSSTAGERSFGHCGGKGKRFDREGSACIPGSLPGR